MYSRATATGELGVNVRVSFGSGTDVRGPPTSGPPIHFAARQSGAFRSPISKKASSLHLPALALTVPDLDAPIDALTARKPRAGPRDKQALVGIHLVSVPEVGHSRHRPGLNSVRALNRSAGLFLGDQFPAQARGRKIDTDRVF